MKQYFSKILIAFILIGTCSKAWTQTTLVPGDIGVFWAQTDTPDDFAFVTYVDLEASTVIYFTDCGVVPSGSFDPAGCMEGAFAYTVPAGGHAIGDVITLANVSAPVIPGNPNFSVYNDALITENFGISTGGDQVTVFQDANFPGGSSNASANPKFIFQLNIGSTLFTGDDAASSTQTGLPTGLQNTVAPFTALGLGSGPGVSDENDNAVYTGSYTFNDVAAAKLALTDYNNYYFTDINPPGDATYNGHLAAIPTVLTLQSVPNLAPTITSAAVATVAENQTSVIDVNATDDNDAEGAGLTYSLTGGADQGSFTIDPNTGIITFNSAPDFEAPTDASGDNIYELQVTVTDSGAETAVQDISITVTDVDDTPPTLVSTDPADNATDVAVDAILTATFDEPIVWNPSNAIGIAEVGGPPVFSMFPGSGGSVSGNTLTLDPPGDLEPGTEYFVLITGNQLEDIAGNPFPGIPFIDWTFTTAPPALLCPTTTIELTTQQQVDDFATTYDVANCSFIGGIEISGSSITDLNGLSGLTGIGGPLAISQTDITSLDGLDALTAIGEDLFISGNSLLTDLSGLDALTAVLGPINIDDNAGLLDINGFDALTVAEDIEITNNGSLTNVSGFNGITSTTGSIAISDNAVLPDFTGFSMVVTIGSRLEIARNDLLLSISGLSSLENVSGLVEIVNNTSLPTISGFNNLQTIGSFLLIDLNNGLTSIDGFTNLGSVADQIRIADNPILASITGFGLNALVDLRLSDNPLLTNLDGFMSLTGISGNLQVSQLDALTNLNGFANLTAIGGSLDISENDILTDLNGLSALTSIGGPIQITGNAALADCDITAVCDNLTNDPGNVSISGNTGSCVDAISVQLACDGPPLLCPTTTVFLSTQQQIDDFSLLYDVANCPFNGGIEIRGADITNVDGLSTLTGMAGSIIILLNPLLTNVNGLSALTDVGGDLVIGGNGALLDLNGLSTLTGVGGNLAISANETLANLNGLSSLTNVGGGVAIASNDLITNLNGLSPLTSVAGDLVINANDALTSLDGLSTLASVGGAFTITNNSSLTNLNGLSALTSVVGDLAIVGNNALSNCTIAAVCDATVVAGVTVIFDNTGDCLDLATAEAACTPALICPTTPIFLSTQQQIDDFATTYDVANCAFDGGIEISGTDITNLDGLSGLTSVGGYLSIFDSELTSLSGLSALTGVGNNLAIFDNTDLTNVDDLSALTNVGGDCLLKGIMPLPV